MKTEKPRPTRGPVKIDISTEICLGLPMTRYRLYWTSDYGPSEIPLSDVNGKTPQAEANADLICAAFNAATEAADLGYDPIEAVRALPKVLTALWDLLEALDYAKTNCKPRGAVGRFFFEVGPDDHDHGMTTLARAALAAARGEKGEGDESSA